MTRGRLFVLGAVVVLTGMSMAYAGTLRDGGDPAKDTIIWGDNFDNYSQWAWDNRDNTAYSHGTLWQGGPVPAGSASGGWPRTSEDGTGCPVSPQATPATCEFMRTLWTEVMQCGTITSPMGLGFDSGAVIASYHSGTCGSGQEYTTSSGVMRTNYTSYEGGSHESMDMFKYSMLSRITAITNYRISQGLLPAGTVNNAVNGTNEKPLMLWFQLIDHYGDANHALDNNCFVELSMAGDHAPTDYIWRGINPAPPSGDPNATEGCPQGPYPIICQQVREANVSGSEDGNDLAYLNANCPPIIPAFDSSTGTGKTWRSIAFGLMAIMDKDPCGYAEQGSDSHVPQVDHFAVFNGNVWRQLRSGRYTALATLSSPPYNSSSMVVGTGGCGNFSFANTTASANIYLIAIKLTTDYIMIYVKAPDNTVSTAAVPRVYTGPFDTVSIGVPPGCELSSSLDAQGQFVCKSGGTPKQCLTYSTTFANGYNRVDFDSMLVYEGDLTYWDNTDTGACCVHTGANAGTCSITTQSACPASPAGTWHGAGSTCSQFQCCPLPFADADHDGDVDQDDFGAMQVCYTGDSGGVPTGCACFDTNSDGSVNHTDVTGFLNCWTGPNVPWTAALTPSCVP